MALIYKINGKMYSEEEFLARFVSDVPSDSEDGLDSDGDELGEDLEILKDRTYEVFEDEIVLQESIDHNMDLDPGPSTSSTIFKKPTTVLWKKKNINIPEEKLAFSGNTKIPECVANLDTPYQYFKYFFDDNLFERLVNESNVYSTTQNVNHPFQVNKDHIQKYIGILILSAIMKASNIRLYWDTAVGIDIIKNTMPVNTFEKIRSSLHFNDNSKRINDKTASGFDILYKLRPVIDSFQQKFLSIPFEESLSVDEQICASKANHHLKQYLPLKPHKWGYKLFVLCGVSGFAYKFEIYTGTENNSIHRLPGEIDLGASSNVVVRLTREMPCFQNHKVYFDNYYTSLPLQPYLANQGIHTLGTVRRNRLPNCKLPTENDMRSHPRGTSIEFVANYDGIEISSLTWRDNKNVNFSSTFLGQLPESSIKRFDRKNKQRVSVRCPAVVKAYNKHMGGVDLLDSFVGRYKITMKSRKWYMRIFYHLLDIAVINAWLLYKRVQIEKGNAVMLNLINFRKELGITLCKMGESIPLTRGRPVESVEPQHSTKRKKAATMHPFPSTDVRLDKIEHFPKTSK